MALRRKSSLLQKELDEAKEEVRNLTLGLKDADRKVYLLKNEVTDLKKRLKEKTNDEIKRLEAELKIVSEELDVANTDLERLTSLHNENERLKALVNRHIHTLMHRTPEGASIARS